MMFLTLLEKLKSMDWILYGAVLLLASVGAMALYSVADGAMNPWAKNHIIRFIFASFLMIIVAVIPLRLWFKLTWVIYIGALILLLYVEFAGAISMGAKRWIDLGILNLQPSEIMKISLILVLAKFYSRLSPRQVSHPVYITLVLLIILIPTILVVRQPDLGTAILIVLGGAGVIVVAGISYRWILGGLVIVSATVPIAWLYILRPYQKKRILTFLDPSIDTLGQGYHILQSKIAIGSGGFNGRGYIRGEQSQFGFLPEKHTDFIFSAIAEEFGFVGSVAILLLVLFILLRIFLIAFSVRAYYSKLLCIGMGVTFFLYVLINTGMVMGLFPVVGVPFPLLSYGGTVMLSIMIAFGFVQNAWVHKMDVPVLLNPALTQANKEHR